MIVAFDCKGTLDAFPKQLGEMMTALKAAGNIVYVLTGTSGDTVTDDQKLELRGYLASIGVVPDMYTDVLAVPEPHPDNKAQACADFNIAVLFDNKKSTADTINQATGGKTLVLVPWATREK